MPRKKRKDAEEIEDDIDEEEEEDEEEDEDEFDPRDFVMARIAAALASSQAAVDALTEALMLFVQPEDDKTGKKRDELVDDAQEALGAACCALELAVDVEYDPKQSEPETEQ